MIDIAASLRKAKAQFQSRGISSDTKIAEHIAFLLVTHEHERQPGEAASEDWRALYQTTNDNDLFMALVGLRDLLLGAYQVDYYGMPEEPPPYRLGIEALRRVMDALSEALTACDAGTLFHRYLRSELLRGERGSQYPTPRHVASSMAQLIDWKESHKVIDPTCGSAGLLVAAVQESRSRDIDQLEIHGRDFDATWAALGWSNLTLHQQTARINVESALSLLPEQARHFDAVLMNPPFGGTLNLTELKDRIDPKYGRRNETVFAVMALKLLDTDGQGAVLVSGGVLFGGGAERELRNRLLQEPLEAVVALPDDVMQPHNSTGANLLLFKKAAEKAAPDNPVWFFQLQEDGYDPGTSRNLTQAPDSNRNELPLMVEAVRACREPNWDAALRDVKEEDVAYGRRIRPSDGVPGNLVLLNGAGRTLRATQSPRGLLTATFAEDKKPAGWFRLPPNDGPVIQGSPHNTEPIKWRSLPSVDGFSDAFPDEWQITVEEDSASARCKFDSGNQQLNLLKGTSSTPRLRLGQASTMGGDAALPTVALVISEDGQPLSPFLTAVDSNNTVASIDVETLDGFGISLMRDPVGETMGAAISLFADVSTDQDTEVETLTAFLLLWTQAQAIAYRLQENGSNVDKLAVLLDDGLLVLKTDDAAQPVIEELDFGEPVEVRREVSPCGLALTTDGKVLGILLDREQITESPADDPQHYVARSFEPREYLVVPEPEQPGLPAEILADIRRNQASLGQRVDALLGMIAAPPRLDQPLPPAAINLPLMVKYFNPIQTVIWEVVREQCQGASAKHFQPEEIWAKIQNDGEAPRDLTEDAVKQQLDLFERMGLIVSAQVKQEPFYRLATPLDDMTIKPSGGETQNETP
jgi:hypothetical protein